ncbi:hypothetical protein HM1_0744 [Heliomicrobium modesticaldum Ice1]|uniref:Uncharacterized protein n=1 Tax=Heliobacterium modesticaldum (strain ATCC 51547 / Ice1) TaxID=498761 RepID=B0TB85_HELMI|nr:hypothetical protein HM1_0744 [Heliomicrobium modesticaldum Ice1]
MGAAFSRVTKASFREGKVTGGCGRSSSPAAFGIHPLWH